MSSEHPALGGDLVWGAEAIGREIDRSPRQTFYLLATGAIPAKLDQIAVKIARICAGDATRAEQWADLAGYASLAGRDLYRLNHQEKAIWAPLDREGGGPG